MIQLVEAYKNNFVGRMFPEVLLKILHGEHPTVSVKDVRNGVIMFSDGRILKCTGDYYEPTGNILISKSANLFLKCRNVRRAFGLDDVGDTNCTLCHIRCISLEQSHEIVRKQGQRNKRRRYK